jgi:hypothetical protein
MSDAGTKLVRVVAVALVAGVLAWAPGTPASACSFAGPSITAPPEVDAGGALVVSGTGFFRIEGEVGADCGGDYEVLPLDDVTVTVTWTTADGAEAETRPAPVTPGQEGAAERYTIGPLEFPVPVDATAGTITSSAGAGAEVAVLGGTTTTVPTTTTPPAATPPPAAPVPAAPRFTG